MTSNEEGHKPKNDNFVLYLQKMFCVKMYDNSDEVGKVL